MLKDKIKNYIIVILIALVGVAVLRGELIKWQSRHDVKYWKAAHLNEKYKAKVDVKDGKVRITGRNEEGEAISRTVDAPPDGDVSVIDVKDGEKVSPNFIDRFRYRYYEVPGSSTTVQVEVFGLLFPPKPMLSVEINSDFELSPNLDLKFLFFYRYGVALGVYPKFMICGDRRLDDLVPFLKNTTLGLYYSISTSEYGGRVAVHL